ncbi:hypothetical protein DXX93_05775 [Thalassotalea euphylliae]|uniref:Glycerophosphodiester phosphodiesterase n=1 Tax=Thalassotalea euphylliae TaxID=1655234 RepID=A0A3E0TQA1_9GAMM|nr:hypothetical protein [Thalassotalea euphylliae]REL26135.1 hypothetical protein DXX93_05775 [Thalassotalea euphylliae]
MLRVIVLCSATLILGACGGSDALDSCIDITPAVTKNTAFFPAQSASLLQNTNNEGRLGLACHNCYDYFSRAPDDTLALINMAILDGVNLIELDVTFSAPELAGTWINHGTNNIYVSFSQVIASSILKDAEQMLFIELKDESYTAQSIRLLLREMMEHRRRDGTFDYINDNRLLILRSFSGFEYLSIVRDVLTEVEFEQLRPYVRISKLMRKSSLASSFKSVEHTHQCGFHMVEFDAGNDIDSLFELARFAKSFGLGVNVFTLFPWNAQAYIEQLVPNIDVATIESYRGDTSLPTNNATFHDIRVNFDD